MPIACDRCANRAGLFVQAQARLRVILSDVSQVEPEERFEDLCRPCAEEYLHNLEEFMQPLARLPEHEAPEAPEPEGGG